MKDIQVAREHLCFAADLPLEQAASVYSRIQSQVGFVKVGLSLFVEHGPLAVKRFRDLGARVFLDLKLHDIPNTVELAAARAGSLDVSFLTVHASGGKAMLEAAVRGAQRGAREASLTPPRVLAVTALTSLNDEEISALGFGSSAASMAARLGKLAVSAGVGGLVCSGREVAALRLQYPLLFLCTPGIRSEGSGAGDQARTETPGAAIRAGASLLVVGRQLYEAPHPEAAAEQLLAEVAREKGDRLLFPK